MSKTSSYVNTTIPNSALPDVQFNDQSTVDKIISTAGDVGNLLSQVDKALHPENYQQPVQQQPHPAQHAGFGWAKWLLIAGAVGTAGYYGKKMLENRKKNKK